MHRSLRFTALWFGALILPGLGGCAWVAASPGTGARTAVSASGVAAEAAAGGTRTYTAGPVLPRPYHLEPATTQSDAVTDGYVHGYSNTYVYETLDRYTGSPLGAADYHDTGGYPVYYPHPYAIFRRYYDDPWMRYCDGRFNSCRSSSGGSSGGSFSVGGGGQGIASSKPRVRSKTGRTTADYSGHQKRSADTAAGRARARSSSSGASVAGRSGHSQRAPSGGSYKRYRQRAVGAGGYARSRGSHRSGRRQMPR